MSETDINRINTHLLLTDFSWLIQCNITNNATKSHENGENWDGSSGAQFRCDQTSLYKRVDILEWGRYVYFGCYPGHRPSTNRRVLGQRPLLDIYSSRPSPSSSRDAIKMLHRRQLNLKISSINRVPVIQSVTNDTTILNALQISCVLEKKCVSD